MISNMLYVCAGGRADDDDSRRIFRRCACLEQGKDTVEYCVSQKVDSRCDESVSYSLTRLKMPLTFRSSTFFVAQSGVGSNGPPQVAPAFATRMSILSSVFFNSSTSTWICSVSATLAAMPTALPETGSLLSFSTAWSMPCSPSRFRAVMMTFFAPASRNAVAAWRPRPLDPISLIRSGQA